MKAPTKRCNLCLRVKLLSKFYASKRMRDGHTTYCKECCNAKTERRRQKLEEQGFGPLPKDPERAAEEIQRRTRLVRRDPREEAEHAGPRSQHWADDKSARGGRNTGSVSERRYHIVL